MAFFLLGLFYVGELDLLEVNTGAIKATSQNNLLILKRKYMKLFSIKNWLILLLALLATPAFASYDFSFTIQDDPANTFFFYNRNHMGGSVSGDLFLSDSGTFTGVQFTSDVSAFGLLSNFDYTAATSYVWGDNQFTINNGQIVGGGLEDNIGTVQLRLNSSQVGGANWLFWNGGLLPVNVGGIGNTLGLAADNLTNVAAVPEPGSVMLLLAGLLIFAVAFRKNNQA